MDNIRLKNFRNIEDSGTIKLKPLTIFVGKNGMGKSSLMRLFPLIKQSVAVSKKGPLLWYSEKGVDFGDFKTVVMHGKNNIQIGFSVDYNITKKESFKVYIEFAIIPEKDAQANDEISYDYVNSLKLNFLGNTVLVEFDKVNEYNNIGMAHIRINGTPFKNIEYGYFMSGIFPIVKPEKEEPIVGFKELLELLSDKGKYSYREPSDFIGMSFDEFKNKLSGKEYGYNVKSVYENIIYSYLSELMVNLTMMIHFEADAVTYIGPFREAPQRDYRFQNLSTRQIDMKGSNMAVFTTAMSKKMLEGFNKMTNKHFDFELEAENHAGHISINIKKDGLCSNIVDTGFGYSQMMPVLLALHSFTHTRAHMSYPFDMDGQFFCIEQPELHLHPSMQYSMGKTFVDSVIYSKDKKEDKKILVETHSRSFIDAVGDAVVDKDININSEDIAVYIFDKIDGKLSIKLSEFDEEGYLNNWPLGFLD